MNTNPKTITPAVSKTRIGNIMDFVAVLCGIGIVMAACMATSALDKSAGFF